MCRVGRSTWGRVCNPPGALTLTGGTIQNGTLDAASFGVQAGTVSAVLGGAGALTKSGPGTVTLSGANSYTGGTTLTGGTLQIAGLGALGSPAGTLGVSGGVLDLGTSVQTSGALTLSGGTIQNGTLDAASFGVQAGTVSAVLGGAGALTMSGPGTVTLSGSNSYTGGTTLTGGTLQIAGLGTLGSPTGTLGVSGGTLDLGTSVQTTGALTLTGGTIQNGTLDAASFGVQAGTVSAVLGGAGALTMSGPGTVTLSGSNSYTGGTTLTGGTLQIAGSGTLGSPTGTLGVSGGTLDLGTSVQTTGALTLTGGTIQNGTLDAASFGVQAGTVSAVLGGAGALTMSGPGTVTLSGSNSYTGGTTLTGGTLQIAGLGTLGSPTGTLGVSGGTLDLGTSVQTTGALTLSGGTIQNGTLDAASFGVQAGTVSAVLGGAGALTMSGPGTVTLSGSNSYTGGTTLTGGTLQIAGLGTLGSPTGTLGVSGGTLDLGTSVQTTGALTLTGGTIQNGTLDAASFGVQAGTVSAVLGGAGALTMSGPGTVTLSGSNSYTGGTTLSGGTLNVSGDNNLGAAAGSLAFDGGTLQYGAAFNTARPITLAGSGGTLDTQNFSPALLGVIAGPGALTKIGTGTLTLLGANTYSGGTSLSAGTLAVGSNMALGTGGLAIAGGTTLQSAAPDLNLGNAITLGGASTVDSQSNSFTLSGNISGGGSLTKIGSGLLTLSGANSYTGGTTLAGGTLNVSGDNNLGAAAGSLAFDGGTLQYGAAFNTARPITLAGSGGTLDTQNFSPALLGVIAGPGALTKIGTGTLTLLGANTYSGGTSLTAGTLAVGSNMALGTGGLAMAGGTTLQSAAPDLNLGNASTLGGASTVDSQSNSFTLSGNISGGGALTKIGSGFLTLSGANTYSGGTTITAGTLIGDTTSLQGNILDNAALVFNQVPAGTYAGSLSGSGSLTIHGPGVVTLTGNSSGFNGETRLAAGALEVGTLATPTASLGGTIAVLGGGILSGHGTVGTVNNLGGGVVMPGGTIGTLTATGNYTQDAASTLAIEVSPTAASQLKVGGAVTLAGTLALTYDPGTYRPGTTYTFISAPSISGSFNQVTTSGTPGLSQNLAFNPSTGQLVLGGAITVAPTNDTVFTAITTTLVQNAQQANGIVLDRLAARLGATGDSAAAFASLTTAPGMPLAQRGASNLATVEGIATALPQAIVEQGGWFRGIGSFGSTNGNGTAPGFSVEHGGFFLGFDRPVAPDAIAGIAVGYTHGDVDEHSSSSGDVNTGRIMIYGGGVVGNAVWSATAGYAHDWIDTQRGLAGIGSERSGYGANEFTLGGQWSLPLRIDDTIVTPRVGARFLHLGESGFTENGATGFNLTGQPDATTSFQPFIGATVSHSFITDGGTQITPEFRVNYAREVADDSRTRDINTIDGTRFVVDGVRPSRDILSAGAGVTVRAQDNLYVYADYDAILPTGNTLNQIFSVGVRIPFPTGRGSSIPEPQQTTYGLVANTEDTENHARILAKQQELFTQTFRDPANLDVIFNYAETSARLGDNEAAVEALERMLLFNPNLPTVDVELGVLYYRLGSFKVAQAYLDKARAQNPSPDVQARIDEYTAKIAETEQASGFSGSFSVGTQYQTDANVGPGSPLLQSPVGAVLLNNQYVKHDDTNFFATGSFLYSYDLGTQHGDAIEVTGLGFGNHYLKFNRLDIDLGEVTAGPRLRYTDLDFGPLQSVSLKPYAIVDEVGLGERQYFFAYGSGFEASAVLWDDLTVKAIYEFRQKNFTNAPDRPLSRGLNGNDNLVSLGLTKPITANSQLMGEFGYLDQSTRLGYYTNNTYLVSAGYHIRYNDPSRLLNLPWETVVFGSRAWSIYAAPDPCCNTSGTPVFSPSARDDRHWRFGITQSFQLTGNMAVVAQLQRDIVSSNLSIYGYTSDSALIDLKVRF